MTAPVVADPEAAAKEYLIGVVADTAHVCYRLPDSWDLAAKPAVTVLLLNEGISSTSESNVMFQFDVWAAHKADAVPVKAAILNALFGLIYQHHTGTDGVMFAAASDIAAVYQPDTSETVRGNTARPTPRYIITATITLGHGV